MPISGFLFDRFGAKLLTLVGLIMTAWGTFLLHKINLNTSNATIIFDTVFRSIGMGLAMMPITTVGMNTVPVQQIARASALSTVVRQVAASFGIAILTATMQHRQFFHYAHLSEAVSVGSASSSVLSQLQSYFSGLGAGSSASSAAVSVLYGIVAKESSARAIGDTFMVAALIIAIVIPFIFFIGKPKQKQEPAPVPKPVPEHKSQTEPGQLVESPLAT